MKAGWQSKRLGEVATVAAGNPAPQNPALFEEGTYPFFRTADAGRVRFGEIRDATDRLNSSGTKGLRLYPKGTILFPKSGASTFLNHRVLLDVEGYVSSHLATIIADKTKVNERYLLYFLSTVSAQDLVQDHAYPSLNLPTIAGIEVRFPPLQEQRRIVSILDEAFEGIATAKANAEKNLQNARDVFDNYLQAVLSRGGEGWQTSTLGEVCVLKSGTTIPVEIERPDGDVPYVKVAEMSMPENMGGVTTSIRFIKNKDLKPTWVIPAGAVIFPKRGGAIMTNKKRLLLVDACMDLNLMAVIPSDEITSDFLYLYFLSIDMRKLGTGSSIPQINNYDIAPLKISFPKSKGMQLEVTKALRAVEGECQQLMVIYQKKITALDDLKQSLLHRAFNGDL